MTPYMKQFYLQSAGGDSVLKYFSDKVVCVVDNFNSSLRCFAANLHDFNC